MTDWKDIQGFEGFYQISDGGAVRALERYIIDRNGRRIRYRGRTIIPWKMRVCIRANTSYLGMSLYKDGVRYNRYVHRLVATAFVPNPQALPEVNHQDGDGTNNRPDNLEWTTREKNMQHAVDTGLIRMAIGERGSGAKLDEGQAREILSLKGREHYKVLAARFGICWQSIYAIWSGRTWSHLHLSANS